MFQKHEPAKIKLLTVQEAAALLHRSPNTIRRMARDTKLDHVKIGKRIFIVADSVPRIPVDAWPDRYGIPDPNTQPKNKLWQSIHRIVRLWNGLRT